MTNLDYITLQAFLEENIDFFIGARLQKIQQPTRRDFVFFLRNNSESRKFYVNINPQFYHICFMGINKRVNGVKEGVNNTGNVGSSQEKSIERVDTEARRMITIPKQPPMFCMLLRKYIEGCKIMDACTIEGERILEFHFETMDEFSQKRSLCLCIELMGKHSNVILYDRETSLIIGCAHNVGPEKSRYRELQGGIRYIYPPKVNSKLLKSEPLYKVLENGETINEKIDNYFSKLQEEAIIKGVKARLLETTGSMLKKVQNSIDKISQLLQKRDKTEEYKLYGELLTANLYQKQDYAPSIEVLNYFTNENIIIELDPNRTLSENAQRYYKLYAKSKTTKEKSSQMLTDLSIEKEYLENVLYSIDRAEKINELEEINSELGIEKTTIRELKNSTTNISLSLLKLEINGFEVYVGKNNKQNDYIISKLSKDEDYWFHTRLCAGSHVLLKVRESEPDEPTLFECCKLARHYSSAAQPSKVGVIYTKRKFIKKPPKAPLGYVVYKNEKEILVD